MLKIQNYKAILTYLIITTFEAAASPATQNESGFKINTDLTAAFGSVGENHLNLDGTKQNTLTAASNDSLHKLNDKSLNVTQLENHVCTREETYVEQLKTPSMQPVRVRSSNWCLEFPPRCSNYKTEMREVMKVQNVTKTRTIRFCCDGYAGNISINDTICKPVCRGGCGRGHCEKPDECRCDAGYIGKHCTQRCDHDHWGDSCKNLCRCENGAVCDNKSGLCHCTTGWTGEFCELPCPAGTFGVMCRKKCECYTLNNNNQCHKQTGECLSDSGAYKKLQPSAENATHAMIQTLNSTIANITHNLDRIAKNIVHIATTPAATGTVTDAATFLLPDLVEITTAHPVPEVIVIKQHAGGGESQHTPKIILHQPGTDLLENLHAAATAAGGGKTPEVIHVITNWQHPNGSMAHGGTPTLDLASIGGAAGSGGGTIIHTIAPPHNSNATNVAEHDSNILSTLLIILLMIMIAIAFGFLYVYRRYHLQKQRVEATLAERNAASLGNRHQVPPEAITSNMGNMGVGIGHGVGHGAGESGVGKSFLKPLPDLPAFTQMVCNKIEGPVYYDTPSSNASVKTIPSYSYARKESLYSVISPKSRKGSLDSHLYDEIRYPLTAQQQQQRHQQQQHHHQQQLPNLQIPPQNIHYLQVPHQQSHSHKINHM